MLRAVVTGVHRDLHSGRNAPCFHNALRKSNKWKSFESNYLPRQCDGELKGGYATGSGHHSDSTGGDTLQPSVDAFNDGPEELSAYEFSMSRCTQPYSTTPEDREPSVKLRRTTRKKSSNAPLVAEQAIACLNTLDEAVVPADMLGTY